MTTNIHEAFLRLVRIGIGHTETTEITENVDWVALKALAERQGLSAVVLDGLNSLPLSSLETYKMPQMLRLEWIGEVLQNYEARYRQYEKTIGSLAGWYNQHGFRMMVLKGYACSLDWPKPEHRPCGDIDVWLFGQQKEADEALQNSSRIGELENKVTIDRSHHHHTVFEWDGFTVENHYDFINVHHHRSHVEMEAIFKELGQDDSCSVEVDDASTGSPTKVYLPSPNLYALFLLKHAALHFASSELTLRQVLDWAFFVEKHGKDVDWRWFAEQMEKYAMTDFCNCLNAICVDDLGFSVKAFPTVQLIPNLKERILADILEPEFQGEEPKRLLPRVLFKHRRWKANEWKHSLCYKESMWSAFWSGVWAHLLKPSSI